jgi:hypothetical protein
MRNYKNSDKARLIYVSLPTRSAITLNYLSIEYSVSIKMAYVNGWFLEYDRQSDEEHSMSTIQKLSYPRIKAPRFVVRRLILAT